MDRDEPVRFSHRSRRSPLRNRPSYGWALFPSVLGLSGALLLIGLFQLVA